MSMKNPLTPAGIEPATFRFVAQRRNHCATAVALTFTKRTRKNKTTKDKRCGRVRGTAETYAVGARV